MNILIISKENDLHVTAVEWGLKKIGISPYIWRWSDFPIHDNYKWQFQSVKSSDTGIWINDISVHGKFDVIWNRRFGDPVPIPESCESDHKIIEKESRAFLKNVMRFIGHENTLWVNPLFPAIEADHKLWQLHAAKQVGFAIPNTYAGNDWAGLLKFFNENKQKIIFKAFLPGGWQGNDGKVTVLKTARVLREHLESQSAINACPAIYQELIEKEYEIRATVIGDKVLAGKIETNSSCLDWRYDVNPSILKLSRLDLPHELKEKCIQICRKLGLNFGCIDMIYTKSGKYIFLEINEAGQFLWKEFYDPELELLDVFCKYLARAGNREIDLLDAKKLNFKDCFESENYIEFINKTQNSEKTLSKFLQKEA